METVLNEIYQQNNVIDTKRFLFSLCGKILSANTGIMHESHLKIKYCF